MTRTHRILIGIIVVGATVIAAIGFVGSYAAVRELAERKGFGDFAPFVPIGIDAGIVVLLALDLLLTWMRIPFPLLRQTAWLLTAATVAFNGAAAWGDPLAVGMHAIIPVLFIITVEAARHAVGRITAVAADKHMEGVRLWRWVLSPFPTFRLWRRMKLWELRSYQEVIDLERDRLVYRARLRARYGRSWRRRAPVEARLPLKLAHLGVPLDPDGPMIEPAPAPAAVAGTTGVGALPAAGHPADGTAVSRLWKDRRTDVGPAGSNGTPGVNGTVAATAPGGRGGPDRADDWPAWAGGENGEGPAGRADVPGPATAGQPDRGAPRAHVPGAREAAPADPLPHLAPRAERPADATGDGGPGHGDAAGPPEAYEPLPDFATGDAPYTDPLAGPYDPPGVEPFTDPPTETVPGSGGRRDLRAPFRTPDRDGGAPEDNDGDAPVGLPAGGDVAQFYYRAYRELLINSDDNNPPNARKLARHLAEAHGVRNTDGNLLSERYLLPIVRECKERYRAEVGVF
nr:DUF2637 domain-containing protein [Streptomyces spiramenti]